MSITYITGQKGVKHLVFDGFEYQIDKTKSITTYYRCVESRSEKHCPGRLHMVDGVISKNNNFHNHVPDIARIRAKEFMSLVKEKGKTTMETPSQIVTSLNVSNIHAQKRNLKKFFVRIVNANFLIEDRTCRCSGNA